MFRLDKEFRREFRENWLLLIVAFLCLLFSLQLSSFILPFAFPEVIKEFGWTREEATSIASTKFLVGAVSALMVGRFVDLFGSWLLLLISTLLVGLSLVVFIWLESLPLYYGIGIVLGFASPGGIVAVKVLVSRAFHASQGTAMGMVLMGSTICGIIAPLAVTYLIGQFGWRWGIALTTAGVWLVVIPALLFGLFSSAPSLRHGRAGAGKAAAAKAGDPASKASAADRDRLSDIIKQRDFWLIGVAIFLAALADQGVRQHQVLILNDLQTSPAWIAIAISGIGFAGIFARVIAGNILDAKSNRGLSFLFMFESASALMAFYLASPVMLVIFIVFRALANASIALDTTVMAKHIFGMKNLGMVVGTFTAFGSLGSAVGPWLLGRIYDTNGSYAAGFILFAILPVVAAVFAWMVKPTYWLEQNSGKRVSRTEKANWNTASPASPTNHPGE